MLVRFLVNLFGGIWQVRMKCQHGLLPKFYRFLYNYYQFVHGSAISYKASFATQPTFPRGMKQIIISENVKMGSNCVIYQQVTIDTELLAEDEDIGAPIIGDNCFIYPGVKIIGNMKIGNNVILESNVVVNKDIKDNSRVSV